MKLYRVPVTVVNDKGAAKDTAMVSPEAMFHIFLNNKEIAKITCRPDHPEEAAVGLLNHFKAIPAPEDIKSIRIHPKKSRISIQAKVDPLKTKPLADLKKSGQNFEDLSIWREKRPAHLPNQVPLPFSILSKLSTQFTELLEVQGILGAFEVAGLADDQGNILFKAGDVDTQVTVDRVMGKAFLSPSGKKGAGLMLSGALRKDTIIKAHEFGIEWILAYSIITSQAFETALFTGIRIIKRLRDASFAFFNPNVENHGSADQAVIHYRTLNKQSQAHNPEIG